MRNLSCPIILSMLTLISGCNSQVQPVNEQAELDKAPHTIAVVPYSTPTASEKTLSNELSSQAVSEVAEHVASWQLAEFDVRSNKMRPEGRSSGIPAGWMYATFNVGLWHWAEALDSATHYQTAINLSLLNDFKLGPRIYHADDHAMGDVYLSIFDKFGGQCRIENTVDHLNQIVDQPSNVSLEFNNEKEKFELQHREFIDPKCTSRWCWADAVFMSPPVMAHLSKTTGDSKYIDFMDKEFWAMTDYLFDENIQLYLRDSRYFTRKDDQGRLIFWGRGNGWVLAGLARVLNFMPEDYPTRARYLELFKNMSAALLKHQNPDGSWPSSLLEKEKDSHSETSATGLLVFGLAWGINNGVLTDSIYRDSVDKAWHSIVENIEPDGRVGFVQQVAFAPGSAKREDSQLYGSGAVLLAAAELHKMLSK